MKSKVNPSKLPSPISQRQRSTRSLAIIDDVDVGRVHPRTIREGSSCDRTSLPLTAIGNLFCHTRPWSPQLNMEGKVPILKRSCNEGLLKNPTQMYRSLLRSFWEALLSGTSWDAVPGRLQDVQQSTTNK